MGISNFHLWEVKKQRAEYFKVHTSHVKINKDGFIEYFGDSRQSIKLDFSLTDTHSGMHHNGNHKLYLSKSVSVIREDYIFPSDYNKRICMVGYLDKSIDISFPLKLKFVMVVDNDTEGTTICKFRLGCSAEGGKVYTSEADIPPNSDTK